MSSGADGRQCSRTTEKLTLTSHGCGSAGKRRSCPPWLGVSHRSRHRDGLQRSKPDVRDNNLLVIPRRCRNSTRYWKQVSGHRLEESDESVRVKAAVPATRQESGCSSSPMNAFYKFHVHS